MCVFLIVWLNVLNSFGYSGSPLDDRIVTNWCGVIMELWGFRVGTNYSGLRLQLMHGVTDLTCHLTSLYQGGTGCPALSCMLFSLTLIHLGFWQNLKMRVSHPRFLIIGNQEDIKSEFPACLTKKTDSVQSDAHANPSIMSDTVFLFPEVSVECFP